MSVKVRVGRIRPAQSEAAPKRVKKRRVAKPKRDEAYYLRKLEELARVADETEQAHKDAADKLHDMAAEAVAAGVPKTLVSKASNKSRQWLYKVLDRER